MTWKHEGKEGQACLNFDSDVPPKAARLWVAKAPTRDFRKAKWEAKSLPPGKGPLCGLVDAPKEGFLALYGELEFDIDGIAYTLSTQIRVVAAK